MVIGFVNDKDINGIIGLLPENAVYYFTQASIPRALPVIELYSIAQRYGLTGNCYHSVAEAFDAAKANAGADDFIFVGGSTFIVSEVL
jgi:dihydrofolate synthase/folylpolyglutamate synthase